MRSLSATDNTNDASGDYPYREVRDTAGVVTGTKLWARIFADMIHGIQKLIRLVGLTPNDLPDNESNGYQILDALELLGQSKVFSGTWTDVGGGNIYLLAPAGIPALIVGKMYRFISDKNLLPSDNVYLKVGAVNYAIKFQNCSYILSNQAFNVYVTGSNSVTITTVGSLNEYYGKAVNRFGEYSSLGALGGISKYKGRYYITERTNYKIKIYTNYGDLISTLQPPRLIEPTGITVMDDKIYVCVETVEFDDDPVLVYNLSGSLLFSFGYSTIFYASIVRSSEYTGKIYVVDDDSDTNNAHAYNAADGLFSFTFQSNDKILDIVVFKDKAYALVEYPTGGTYINTYDSNSGALIKSESNKFQSSDSVFKFYGVTDNYFVLKSGSDVVLVDRNYSRENASSPYGDILKTVIYDYNFDVGNVENDEIYLTDNSSAAGRFSVNVFI